MSTIYSEDADGSAIELKVNQDFEISLPESRMGGYHWSLVEDGAPTLKVEELPGTASGPALPGERGNRSWRFTAKLPGSTQLRLQHLRSWESIPSREFRLKVNVQG